jgi:uncharacterized membrane protein YjgN (DUF898 family)
VVARPVLRQTALQGTVIRGALMVEADFTAAGSAAPETRHGFEFRGTGSEYFGIWIVNLVLTIVTIGVYGAWAKVRTKRYFNGSTWVAGHAFDYHASGLRILIGRAIALGLFVVYQIAAYIHPGLGALCSLAFLLVFPWLVNSSIRFNARNTSYRNIRFNFTARDMDAFVAYIVWPVLGFVTLGLLWPYAQRQKDKFFIDHHTFGRRYFEADISVARMYLIFVFGTLVYAVLIGLLIGTGLSVSWILEHKMHTGAPVGVMEGGMVMAVALFYLPMLCVAPAIHTMIVNLSVSATVFDEKHRLESTLSPLMMIWIMASNVVLIVCSVGFYYPWAKVRLARYQMEHMTLIAKGDVDAYVSEVFDTQSAVGEEIGSVFSFDFGL